MRWTSRRLLLGLGVAAACVGAFVALEPKATNGAESDARVLLGEGGARRDAPLAAATAGAPPVPAAASPDAPSPRAAVDPPEQRVAEITRNRGGLRVAIVDATSGEPIPAFSFTVAETSSTIVTAESPVWSEPTVAERPGARGILEVGGLEPSTYAVLVQALGYEPGVRGEIAVEPGTVTEGERLSLRRPPPPIKLHGRVLEAESGAPIAGAQVKAGKSESAIEAGTFVAVTDANGRYRLVVQERGSWTLRAFHPERAKLSSRFVLTGEGAEPIEGPTFELPRTGAIRGTAAWRSGAPASVRVHASLDERDTHASHSDHEERSGARAFVRVHASRASWGTSATPTDDEGRFELRGLPTGRWRISATSVDTDPERSSEAQEMQADAVVVADSTAWVELRPTGGAAEITVVDGAGRPVDGAEVTVHEPTGGVFGRTFRRLSDRSGTAWFHGLRSDECTLTVTAPGFALEKGHKLGATRSDAVRTRLVLAEGVVVRFVGRTPSGEEVRPNLYLVGVDERWGPSPTVAGSKKFPSELRLRRGPARVRVSTPEHKSVELSFDVGPGPLHQVEVTLEPRREPLGWTER